MRWVQHTRARRSRSAESDAAALQLLPPITSLCRRHGPHSCVYSVSWLWRPRRDASAVAQARIEDDANPLPSLVQFSPLAPLAPLNASARRARAERFSTPLLYAWLKDDNLPVFPSDDREHLVSLFANYARIEFHKTEGEEELAAFQNCWRRINKAAVKAGREPPGWAVTSSAAAPSAPPSSQLPFSRPRLSGPRAPPPRHRR